MGELLWKYLGVDETGAPRLSFLDDLLFRLTQPQGFKDHFELRPTVIMERFSEDDRRYARREAAKVDGGQPMSDEDAESHILGVFGHSRYTEKEFPGLVPAYLPELRPEPFMSVAELDEYRTDRTREQVETTLNSNLAVFSMSESPTELPLWDNYGEGGSGIVVGFDRNVLAQMPEAILQPVEYNPERITISSNHGFIRIAGEPFNESGPWPVSILLRKSPFHAWEKEVRMILPLRLAVRSTTTAAGEPLHLFQFPPTAIRSVVLGSRASQSTTNEVIERLRSCSRWSRVRLMHARPSTKSYELDLHPISWG